MKKAITLAAVLLTLGAPAAMAQNGLDLNWDECVAGGGLRDKVFACNTNTGAAFTLHASVTVPTAMTQFAAATAVIDLHVDDVALPAWWLTASGECRANSIGMSFDPSNNATSCADVWSGNPNLQVTQVQAGLHGANSLRVIGVSALPSGSEIPLAAGSELWLCRVTINRANTLTCTGCLLGACIVFNQSEVLSPSEPKQTLVDPATAQHVTWNGGGALNCPAGTPTVNRTWGAVKNLYR